MWKKILLIVAVLALIPVILFATGVISWPSIITPPISYPSHNPTNPQDKMAYITPNDAKVQQQLNEILNSWVYLLYSDYHAIRQWTATNISYVSDQEAHGVREYWQLPRETLELSTGDCEDFAILVCTFLRANGMPADEVYIVCGCSGNTCHGYLLEWRSDWWQGEGWVAIEPQQGIWTEIFIGTGWLLDYEVVYCFNDQHYYNGIPPRPV